MSYNHCTGYSNINLSNYKTLFLDRNSNIINTCKDSYLSFSEKIIQNFKKHFNFVVFENNNHIINYKIEKIDIIINDKNIDLYTDEELKYLINYEYLKVKIEAFTNEYYKQGKFIGWGENVEMWISKNDWMFYKNIIFLDYTINYGTDKIDTNFELKLITYYLFRLETRYSLEYYTSNKGFILNNKIRNNLELDEEESKIISDIDKAFKNAPNLTNNIILYRGIAKEDYINNFSYNSCSLDLEMAKNFGNIILKINVYPGCKILPLSGLSEYWDESEVLLDKNLNLEIIDSYMDGKFKIINVESKCGDFESKCFGNNCDNISLIILDVIDLLREEKDNSTENILYCFNLYLNQMNINLEIKEYMIDMIKTNFTV